MALYTITPNNSTYSKFGNERVISDGTNKTIFTDVISTDNLEEIKTMKCKESDIFLISYPRSGTTMMQRIILALKTGSGEVFSEPNFHMDPLFPFLEFKSQWHDGWLVAQEQIINPYRLIKTHLPYWLFPTTTNGKKICVTRDVKDVLVSSYHFRRNMKNQAESDKIQLDTFTEMFTSGLIIFGDWFDWHRGWLDASDEQTLWIRYEDLLQDFEKTVRNLAEFINVDLTSSLLSDVKEAVNFDRMKREVTHPGLSKDFVRKGIVGDHVNYLNKEQIELLNEKTKNIVPELA